MSGASDRTAGVELTSLVEQRLAAGQRFNAYEGSASGWQVGIGPISDFLGIATVPTEAMANWLIERLTAQTLFGSHPAQLLADVGLPVAAALRSLVQLRPLMVDAANGRSRALVDAAYLQAFMISVADLMARANVDPAADEATIAAFADKLRSTIGAARLLA